MFRSKRFIEKLIADKFAYHIYTTTVVGYEHTVPVKCAVCNSNFFVKINKCEENSYEWHCFQCDTYLQFDESNMKPQGDPNLITLVPYKGVPFTGERKALKLFNKNKSGFIIVDNPFVYEKPEIVYGVNRFNKVNDTASIRREEYEGKLDADAFTQIIREAVDLEICLKHDMFDIAVYHIGVEEVEKILRFS